MTLREALYNLDYVLAYHIAIKSGELEGRTILTEEEVQALEICVSKLYKLYEVITMEE